MELSEDELIFNYLSRSRVQEETLRKTIIPHLNSKGFSTVGDLQDLEKKYLDNEGISELDQDRILRLVKKTKSEEFDIHTTKSQTTENESIYLRYILCKSLFGKDIEESTIVDIKRTISLKDIVSIIHKEAKATQDEVIELYSGEGYPLHNNELTNMESLIRWGINDGDLFFVIIRPKDQPAQLQFATLPKVDHDTGEETFTIETPFQEIFTVNAYIDSDSPEDIAQKIYSITNIPVPYMSLYVRNGCSFERLNTFTELKDNDVIRVILRNPQEVATPRSPYYGLNSYTPRIAQTKEGMCKFYSILKFVCSLQPYNEEYEFDKLLSYLLTTTEFPPLVHALCTLRERSYLTIAGWAALIEGFFFLFKAILADHINVADDKIFEYSDYAFALLIYLSKEVGSTDNIENNQHSLVCPLSEKRICTPVQIQSHKDLGFFDKTNCLFKIENSGDFSNFGIHQMAPDDLIDDEETGRYLMYYPWESDDKIIVWKKPPTQPIPATCKKVQVSTKWTEMIESLKELCIIHPHGLYAGNECLTFVEHARLVYFLGAAKGTDETRRLFDPLHIPKRSPYQPCPDKYVLSLSKKQLYTIGNSPLAGFVSHDLTSSLKITCSAQEKAQYIQTRENAIVQPESSIQWEPEEAIVVLLDYSGSMGSSIFHELHNLRTIDAAKELFNAFATRTQAYKLHHAFGLTLFDHETDMKLSLTKNVEDFETSLEEVNPRGGTNIPKAILEAVRQLSTYSCLKRILCLTDGYDYSSYAEALQRVQSNNIVVDTILLMSPDVGNKLKALSHASGGVCVCPQSMNEALQLFELDPFLSLKARVKSNHPNNLSGCSNTSFETKESFQSQQSQSFSYLSTISAKSYIDRDISASQSNVLPHQKRIIKELREFIHTPHNDIKVYPSEHEYAKWKVLMRGPKETPYESGVFVLSINFPSKYPSVPPEVKFITPIYHCNVSASNGRICHSVLGEGYTPAISMKDLLCHIYGLLMSPDMDSPLDSVLADEFGYLRKREADLDKPIDHVSFFGAAKLYFQKARDHVQKHASSKSFEAWDKELAS